MPQNPMNVLLSAPVTAGMAVLLCVLASSIASAQSESELRQQGARQAQQIKDLQAELAAMQTRIQELEAHMEELRTRLAAQEARPENTTTGQPDTPTQGKATQPTQPASPRVRPKTPFQSPDTVLATMRWDFEHDLMKDPSFALGVDSDNERAKTEAATALESWISRTNRQFRKSITWSVKILDEQPQPDGSVTYTVQPLGPDGRNAGRSFMQVAPARVARRVTGWQEQPDLARLLMKGTLEPNLTPIRQQRTDTSVNTSIEYSTSDVRVSQYVRFEFSVRLSSMMPIFVERTPESKSSGGPDTR